MEQQKLDSLLAHEIDRRLGAPGQPSPSPEALRALLHLLRGSASLAGYSDLTLVATQLGQRMKSGELDACDGAVTLLRRVSTRLKQGAQPFECVWPEPPEGLQPSVVAPELKAEYVGTMRDRVGELKAVVSSRKADAEQLACAVRVVHTMKSLAASVGDDTTTWYCHHLEARLRNLPNNDPDATLHLLSELVGQSDVLLRLVEDPAAAFIYLRRHSAPCDSILESAPSRSREPTSADAEMQETRRVPNQSGHTTFARVLARCERAALRFAESEGKSVRVEIAGGGFPTDESTAERLIEPLLQIVKNAITHGIESPEQRRLNGKSSVGVLRLSAERQGEGVRLVVEDDGAGVDLEIVRRCAIERGLSSEAAARLLGESELLGLLFVPGLSTRSQPNLLSGCGMGLDLSQDAVRRLGGEILLSARASGGVCVMLELPQCTRR
jgi:chemotaxis protein histidine kinase CheA